MYDLLLEDAKKEDLAGVYTEVAEQIGMENAYALFQIFRGQQLTFPLKFYSSSCIAQRICDEFNGHNTRELAKKYRCSESRVRQVLAKEKRKES